MHIPIQNQCKEKITKKVSFRQVDDVSMNSFKIVIVNYDLYSVRYSDLNEFTENLILKLNDSYCKYFPLNGSPAMF